MSKSASAIAISRGPKIVCLDCWRVCVIDARAGELRCRAYWIHDLAQRSSVEESHNLQRKDEATVNVMRMAQPEDLGAAILFVTTMPARTCVNELIISPTWNRLVIGGLETPAR